RAQRGSISTSARWLTRSASAFAASYELAPPLDASGRRNGCATGGADHHAAQKKRPRWVRVIDTTAAESSVIGEGGVASRGDVGEAVVTSTTSTTTAHV